MAFRVIVDPDMCESNGVCEGIAPELFRLGEEDLEPVRVLQDPAPDELRAQAEHAVRSCPKQAIRIG